MCCNGVMFHTVELQPTDSPRQIAALGVKLKHKAGKICIQQPCPAFVSKVVAGENSIRKGEPLSSLDSYCSIYTARPERCQLFECRQLSGVKTGAIPLGDAMERIRIARELVAKESQLFEQLGETSFAKPRGKRFNNIMGDLPGEETPPEVLALRAALVAITEELDALLDESFRVKRVEIEEE